MYSVKDSFESGPPSSPPTPRNDAVVLVRTKEKPTRGIAIPDGIATGFKKASELLRDAEKARLTFESLSNNKESEVAPKPKEARRKVVARSKKASKGKDTGAIHDTVETATETIPELQVYCPHFETLGNVEKQQCTEMNAPMVSADLTRSKTNNTISPSKSKTYKTKSSKSPVKRKALTITEKAVHEFRPEEIPDTLSLLEYFPATASKATEPEASAERPKSKSKQRAKKSVKKSSLLQPSDALQSLRNQKFVFNTSSQLLIHSSSPILEPPSNTIPPEPRLERDDSFVDIDVLIASSGINGFQSTKTLWSAATRKEDGSLMDVDVIDLSESVLGLESVEEVKAFKSVIATSNAAPTSELHVELSRGRNLVDLTDPVEPAGRPAKSIPSLPRSLGEAATRQRPTSKSPVKKKRKTKVEVKPAKPEDAFKNVPLNELKATLKGFGHKPPRSRKKIVDLILLCQAQQAQNEAGVTAPMTERTGIEGGGPSDAVEIPLSNGISENADARIAIIHEARQIPVSSQPNAKGKQIEASDELGNPPPSFQTPALPLSQEVDEAGTEMLLSGIHRAIAAQPPTHSIANPSWKEKIAMYDPIILEELTTWLNTGGLDAVGIDTEVWPALVRDWCESKSVCFIWASEGWRKKRS